MKKRQIGTSDLWVSEIGFGCMSIGTDEKNALYLLDEAIDSEINYFDTADLYDRGINEELVGKALKGKRDKFIIATKVGNRLNELENGWTWDASSTYILQAVKESLRRLQTDYIDLYQLHGGTIEDNIDNTIEAFEQLKKEGYIRAYGISSIRPNVILEYVKRSNISSVMMQYSLLDRRPEEWFSLLQENSISIIARGPVAKGILSERKQPLKNYLDYSVEELQDIKNEIQKISSLPLHEIALQYDLHHMNVASVIPGASKVEQLKANITNNSLTNTEYEQLQKITKASVYKEHR